MGQIGKRMFLLLFSFTLLVMQSFALERHPTTTVKAAGRGQDDGEAGNEQANGQTDAHETTATPVQNRDETGGSAGPSGTTAKTGDSRGNNNNKYNPESGTNATERSGESVTPTETPRQSGNQDEVNSTQTNSAQGEGVREFSDQEDPQDPHDGRKGTERPSNYTSHHEAGGGAQNNGQGDGDAAVRAMTTPNNGDGNEENRKEDVRTDPTGQEEETGKEGNDGDRTTRRPEEIYQSHGKRVTTTVATDERDPSSQGDKTAKEDGEVTQSRHEENEEHAQTTPKINMNERHQSSAPSDQGQTDDAKATNQPNKNEKRATEEPPSEIKDQAMTSPRTATGQMPQTEKPQEREDTEYARTTAQNADVHEMGERKATVRPSDEGSGDDDNAKGTQTERPQDQRDSRHAKTTPKSVFVSMGEKGKPTDSPRGEGDGGDNESHTLSDQSSQTENPHDQENNKGEDMVTDRANVEGTGGHGKGTPADETGSKEERPVRTTPKSADAIREEEKVTERPNGEGTGAHGKGTPADETESNEERQVTRRTQGDGVKPTPKGSEENTTTVYRLPRLVLAETQFTLSDDEKCTPFTLTFNIPQPQGGGKQTQPPGTDEDEEEEEEEEESGTDGDSETTTVISYEDFSALRMAQFSLPPLPFVLGAQDTKVLQGKTKRFKIDSTSFESDNQLMIEGRFCDMKSRILELCLSFNGHTRIRTRDAPEGKCHNITVYSDAPALSSARLSDAGDSVVIFFNKGVSAGKELRECSAIFDDATLELFGENAQCQWRSGNLELVVRLGKSSTIATGSQITLRDDRIRAFKERFSHTASGSFDVHAPNNRVTPKALIDGEPKVPDCGSVKLSALRSEGGGSRGLTYTWSLESPTENVDGGITKLLRKANNGNKAVLVIPASLLPEVTPYEWGLTVMNVLDLEDSTTFTVRKANAREPNFEIRTNGIPKKGAVKITSAVSLVGDISFNRPGCPKETASEVQFQWSISGAEFEEGVLTTDKRILKFPRRSLPADADIEATLNVTYGTEDVMTLTRTVTFSTANEPLVARIKGGERTTTGVASDDFTLDCSLSRDPNYQDDEPDEGLTFEWRCWQETDKENCYYNDPEGETIQLPTTDQGSTGSVLTVVPSTLTAGKVYSFSCYVGKEEMEEQHDSVTIEVTENNPPRISLSLIKSENKAYRPGRDVEIRAVVDGDDISEMTWEDIGGGLDGFGEDALTLIQDTTVDEEEETTLTTSEDADTDKPYTITISKKMGKYIVLLRINKDQLQAGSEYEMQFSALNGEELGSSTIGFEVGAKVTGCQFEFGGNDSYVDTATDVTYAVEACASEGEDTLNYQAFASFPVDGKKPQMKFLGRTSEYPEIEVDHEVFDRIKRKVEAEEEVSFQVGMRVCYQDTRVCSVFKKDVTYVHQALTEEEVVAKKEEINDLKKEGKSVEALKAANSVQNARADQTVEGERKRRATVDFDRELLGLQKELLLLATGDSSNFDGYPGDIQSMADAAIDVPIQAFQHEEMREILEADKNVLEAAKDLDDPLPQDTLDGIRQHLEDAKMAFTDTKFFTENREILGLLSKCMSKNLATGERVTSYGDDILITIEATLNIDPISIPMGDGDISFNGGDDVRNRYDASWEGCGCDECVGVFVEFFIYRGQDYVAGESHDSDVIGLRFISPCTGEAMPVEDLIDPITMSVPFTSPLLNTTNPICSFYNESLMTWSQRGVATRVHGMDVVCETNHTTEYVIDFTDEDGAMAEPTSTMTWGGEVSTRDHGDEDDDDDDDGNIPGLNGLLGLGIGVIAGIVVASLVVLAVIIILLAVVIKNMNKPKVIVEPVIDIKA